MRREFSRLVLLPYKQGSESARKIAQSLTTALGAKVRRVRPDGKYRPKLRSLIVNYGLSAAVPWLTGVNRVLNRPEACRVSGNKLAAFRAFAAAGVVTPEFTDSRQQAAAWIAEGHTVVCRTMLSAHSGRGIVLADTLEKLVNCQLYVKYKKKRKEFRVHVFRGEIIDVSEKRRLRRELRPDHFDGYIRNHANGWIFARDGIVEPGDLRALAISACRACGLDFGAVDVIWNEKEDKCYVLEVNTAPGVTGTTLERYVSAISKWVREA